MSRESPKLRPMRNLSTNSPSLFAPEVAAAGVVEAVEPPREKQIERHSEAIAREFIKWCCGFGADFRNSPDLANLRFWCENTKLKLKDDEKEEVLAFARRLFSKKLEQLTRKVDASLPQMNTMSE